MDDRRAQAPGGGRTPSSDPDGRLGSAGLAALSRQVRWLKLYALVSSALLVGLIFLGAQKPGHKARFDEIDVGRINVVEPDGTLKLVLSNKASFPGLIFKMKEYPHPNRKTAGILFFNDDGTENGGLIFGGRKEPGGTASGYGHLSFDAFEQDQVFSIDASEEGGKKTSGLAVIDRPDYSIIELVELMERVKGLDPEAQKAEFEKFQAGHGASSRRLYLGRRDDQSVALQLMDPQGRERIRLRVGADGTPTITLLDASGRAVSEWPPK